MEPADELLELPHRPGLGQPEMTNVVVEVDLVVVDPERMVDVPRHLDDLLEQHREEMQPARDVGLVDVVEAALESGRQAR